jgi:ribA/ribD-fused uncharacterized protein
MRETEKYYFFWKHLFGQWSLRDIVDFENIKYNCSEQYMMAKKAKLFQDEKSYILIMDELNPKIQQDLGRLISNFDQRVWDEQKEKIVYTGNYLKFSQHKDLQKKLIETNPKILVEASPHDLIWGVGLSSKNDLILNEKNWKGQNLLGKILMKIREDLK